MDAKPESTFVITISDGFCKWEFGINPENAEDLSIKDILNPILEKHETKETYSKLL